jgi:hypothetical protein
MTSGETVCLWCAAPVTLRRGGSPRKFCCARCRHELHSCARQWAEAAVAADVLSVSVLKNGEAAACTLLFEARSLVPVVEPPWEDPMPALPCVDNRSAAQEYLAAAMARANAIRRR